MPIFDLQLTPDGAIIDALFCVSVPRRRALQRSKKPVPAPIAVRMLVDTGANCTCLESGTIAPLNLSPTGQNQIWTPSTGSNPQSFDEYDVSITIPLPPSGDFRLESHPIIECQALDGPYEGLLGRDILAHCTFFWNGKSGTFSIAF